MLKDTHTFHTIVGERITSKVHKDYVLELISLFDNKCKLERNYKRKFERLELLLNETQKISEFLVNHDKIKELSTLEANSIQHGLFLFCDITLENRNKVIEYMENLK
jgi:hypothetical protein